MKKDKKSLYYIISLLVIIILIIALFLLFKKDVKVYKIELLGDRYIILSQGDSFIEPGYNVYLNDKLSDEKINITNEIGNTPGIYKVIYQIDNIYEYRYVEIKEKLDPNLDINLDVNITNKTNKNIDINIRVSGDMFYSIILPDGNIIYSNYYTYTVEDNGIYKFIAKNTNEEEFVKEINIDNIDKIAPNGTCEATLTNTNTTIKVTSESNLTYEYYDNNNLLNESSDSNYITTNKTSEIIKVNLLDEADNSTLIKCNIIDKRYYEQVKPSSTDKIVFNGNSDTFKTYIVDKGSYFLSYFWVKDAYTQFNKYDSPEYGKTLYYPKDLLIKAKNDRNLNGKIVVGFNASGFYLKGVFDAYSVERNRAYDKTSVGTLVITNGKVVRNAYEYAVKTWYMIGINKDNKMLVFEDKESKNIEEKKAWSQTVINSGIRNTFTFAAPLIENGKRTDIKTSMPGGMSDPKGLQIICQINENNYLLFTSKNESRNKAIDVFLKHGCQTAMNLDGGGSVALFYKDKNSSEYIKVIGGGRQLPEVGYFTE